MDLACLDVEVVQVVRDDDLARFVLVDGWMGDIHGSIVIDLPVSLCFALNLARIPLRHLCGSVEQLTRRRGGGYSVRLNQMLR